jgi:glycosyltransferase involved in cell wall biosynthesis
VVGPEQKGPLLRDADVLVLPVRQPEGQPLVVLEAMAAGLPVVATRRGAIPEMVDDGVTGLLVPERDVGALAAALDRLRRDPARRRALGEAARRRWAAEFTAELAIARVSQALEEVIGQRRAPHAELHPA